MNSKPLTLAQVTRLQSDRNNLKKRAHEALYTGDMVGYQKLMLAAQSLNIHLGDSL